jgi:hypothetical protein
MTRILVNRRTERRRQRAANRQISLCLLPGFILIAIYGGMPCRAAPLVAAPSGMEAVPPSAQLQQTRAQSLEYELAGTANLKLFSATRGTTSDLNARFRVLVKDPGWLIQVADQHEFSLLPELKNQATLQDWRLSSLVFRGQPPTFVAREQPMAYDVDHWTSVAESERIYQSTHGGSSSPRATPFAGGTNTGSEPLPNGLPVPSSAPNAPRTPPP